MAAISAKMALEQEAPTLEVASLLGLADLAALATSSPAVAAAFRGACPTLAFSSRPPPQLECMPGSPDYIAGEVMDLICGILAASMRSIQVGLESLELPDGRTALSLAASAGRPDVARWLLHGLGSSSLLSKQDMNGASAIHYAALAGHNHVVELLLQAGASADASDKEGVRPLHLAAEAGHVPVCCALLGAEAEVNARDATGGTPLLLATEERHIEVCKLLLQWKADPLLSNSHGRTAMSVAHDSGAQDLLMALEGAIWPSKARRLRRRSDGPIKGPEAMEMIRQTMRLR